MLDIVREYFGNTFYVIILLILLICIFNKRDYFYNKKLLVALGIYCVAFPILFVICNKLGMRNVFYRILWLVPLSLIIGMASVWILKKKENARGCYVLLACVVILLVGNICLDSSYWKLPDNIYKVDQNVIEVADLMENDADQRPIIVIGELEFMLQIRQYSSHFWWGYTNRDCTINADSGNVWDESARLAGAIQCNYFPTNMDAVKDLQNLKVDYLVLYKDNIFIEQLPRDAYEVIGETVDYKVLKFKG